jgi:hypothetical protein
MAVSGKLPKDTRKYTWDPQNMIGKDHLNSKKKKKWVLRVVADDTDPFVHVFSVPHPPQNQQNTTHRLVDSETTSPSSASCIPEGFPTPGVSRAFEFVVPDSHDDDDDYEL